MKEETSLTGESLFQWKITFWVTGFVAVDRIIIRGYVILSTHFRSLSFPHFGRLHVRHVNRNKANA